MTKLHTDTITLQGIAPESIKENPLPSLRDTQLHSFPEATTLPLHKQVNIGKDTAFRILPYSMQDEYTRAKETIHLGSIVLENNFLKAVFIPSVGGRLWSLFDKEKGKELLFCNPVFQPANLARRNAWFAGGIEWNIGHFGHACHTTSPIFAAKVLSGATPLLRLYDYERVTGLFWQLDFNLPDDSKILFITITIHNISSEICNLYWWTNTALTYNPRLRILAPATDAIFLLPQPKENKDKKCFGWTNDLPFLPSLSTPNPPHKVDGSYPANSHFANEFFFQCENENMPWQAGVEEDGYGFFECSTPNLPYRKLFCWGLHQGGQNWQRYLSEEGSAYVEIQAGLAPTQLHSLCLQPASQLSMTQAMGALHLGAPTAHSSWEKAIRSCKKYIVEKLKAPTLDPFHSLYKKNVDAIPEEILYQGSPWGGLELLRKNIQEKGNVKGSLSGMPFHCKAELEEIEEVADCLYLLKNNTLPTPKGTKLPTAWICGMDWKKLIEDSLLLPGGKTWYSYLLLGVAQHEALKVDEALRSFQTSLHLQPNPWAWRNIGYIKKKKGEGGLDEYIQAWKEETHLSNVESRLPCSALALEYVQTLLDAKQYTTARHFILTLPEQLRHKEAFHLVLARVCLSLELLDEAQVCLTREFANIKEGENELFDLLLDLESRKIAKEEGLDYQGVIAEQCKAKVRALLKIPATIDFSTKPMQ